MVQTNYNKNDLLIAYRVVSELENILKESLQKSAVVVKNAIANEIAKIELENLND